MPSKGIDLSEVIVHRLRTPGGLICDVTNYGARIVRLFTPDRKGNFEDIVLGFDTIEEYLRGIETYFGAAVGRVANRIADAKFELNGETFKLDKNHGKHHIHGGTNGIHAKVWAVNESDDQRIYLSTDSPEGESGYPGNLKIDIVYALSDEEGLSISYKASTDRETPLNLTNHSYFNLLGAGNGSIEHHRFQINASSFLPTDSEQIPTGEIRSVEGSDFDLRQEQEIGSRLQSADPQIKMCSGFDHHFVADGSGFRHIATAKEPTTGRVLEVWTDQPGMQFFCGKAMSNPVNGKLGKTYGARSAFCMETQGFPDAVNHNNFPSILISPEKMYNARTNYRFDSC